MKNPFVIASAFLFFIAVAFTFSFRTKADESLKHIVVFKYKKDATQEQIQQITDAFEALQDKIPGIISFEHGINNSPEGKNMGFTHVYQVAFESAQARDNYLPHPEHKKFGELLGKLNILDDAFVVDYIPKD